MQIVIDIPKGMKDLIDSGKADINDIGGIALDVIRKGIVLPKGHGRLIDTDAIALIDENFVSQSDYVVAECAIENTPTVLEAEKED